ncbi:Holo-[acyl-carrier-protein] synthase [Candidatus Magnetaquicoccaceae bacterium FCR-1]|uniref:Holo-[acyl-carrier-protein] synthase n=1 Tax=Candidatus Magnetaquiglobus chichijimensis TaxID=3141448 RepID=A0ABQ0C6U3_9PROT
MILGIGTDLVAIDRIGKALERHPERFSAKVYTDAERQACALRQETACLAKRFAAKEALAKALGTGMRDGVWFTGMEVGNDPLGRPTLRVNGETARRLEALRVRSGAREVVIHLSLADESGLALAYVVLEGVFSA